MDITTATLPSADEMAEQRRLQTTQEMLKQVMSVKNNDNLLLAAASKEDLMKGLLFHFLNEGEAGQEVESSDEADAASDDQQLKDAAAKEEESAANNNKKKPRKQKKYGGFNISPTMVAFGSIMILIFSFSLIHQIGGSGEGGASLSLPPPASRFHRKTKDQSNNDHAASPEIIMSPLPASIVAPPPIFSPAVASNQGMKFNKLRSSVWTCYDTPNWEDVDGLGCDSYELYDWCFFADDFAGDMGSATEHCCICEGGTASLPLTNSPTISNSPTKSATPSSSFKPSISPTKSANPSTSSHPTHQQPCFNNTPDWEDKDGFGCDHYEATEEPGCPNTDDYEGKMGPATKHCCYCVGESNRDVS